MAAIGPKEANAQKPTIGITGCVWSDGYGDLDHIINASICLQENFGHIYNFVHSIELEWEKNMLKRMQIIRDKLVYKKIINPLCDYKGSTVKEIRQKINLHNPQFHFWGESNLQKITAKEHQEGNRYQHLPIHLWVSVSTGLSFEPQYIKDALSLELLEHSGSEYWYDPDLVVKNVYYMGFSHQDEKAKDLQGIFLKNHAKSAQMQINALRRMKNERFLHLIHGNTAPITEKEAAQIVDNTMIIPTFIQWKPYRAKAMVLAACTSPLASKYKNVLVTSKTLPERMHAILSKEVSLKDEVFRESLIKAKFTHVVFMSKVNGFVSPLIYGKDKIEEVQLQDGPRRTLTILSDAYFDEADYEALMHLPNEFLLCSGDNTFQECISRKILPLIDLRADQKELVLNDLVEVLVNHPRAARWADAIKLIALYKEICSLHDPNVFFNDINIDKYIEPLSECFTLPALKQWEEVCEYLALEHNAFNKLPVLVKEKLNALKQHEEKKQDAQLFASKPAALVPLKESRKRKLSAPKPEKIEKPKKCKSMWRAIDCFRKRKQS